PCETARRVAGGGRSDGIGTCDRRALQGYPGRGMGPRTRVLLGIALLVVASGCGHTFVVKIPEMPRLFGGDDPPGPRARAQNGKLEECPFMTVMIDYSREGDPVVGERVA